MHNHYNHRDRLMCREIYLSLISSLKQPGMEELRLKVMKQKKVSILRKLFDALGKY